MLLSRDSWIKVWCNHTRVRPQTEHMYVHLLCAKHWAVGDMMENMSAQSWVGQGPDGRERANVGPGWHKFYPSAWAWLSRSSRVKLCHHEHFMYVLFHTKNSADENMLMTWEHAHHIREWEKVEWKLYMAQSEIMFLKLFLKRKKQIRFLTIKNITLKFVNLERNMLTWILVTSEWWNCESLSFFFIFFCILKKFSKLLILSLGKTSY